MHSWLHPDTLLGFSKYAYYWVEIYCSYLDILDSQEGIKNGNEDRCFGKS